MFKSYTIVKIFNDGDILFRFDEDLEKIIQVNIKRDFLDYELSDFYFKDDHNHIIKLEGYNYPYIFKNRRLYKRVEQYEYDKYCTHFPNTSNGKLYHHLYETYKKLFI